MKMSDIREKSKIFLWVCLIGFVLSLVGVMGTSSGGGGGFLGGASLTSLFSNSVNPALYVGKVGDKKITRSFFATELRKQRASSQQFQINTTESYYIGRAWDAIISSTIINNKIEQLNLKTQDQELKQFLRNTPPISLQNFLTQNNLFKLEDESFDLELYQYSIDENIKWIPDSLINVFTNYESQLKSNDLPRQKLQSLYSMLASTSDLEIKNEINKSTQTCNIDILSLDYKAIDDSKINVDDSEIEKYYTENIDEKFSIDESIKLDYILFENIENENDSLEIVLNEEQRLEAIDFALDAQPDIMGFNAALEEYDLSITGTIDVTEKFTNNSGIPLSMGYSRAIVRFAFDNDINSVSDRIITDDGIAIFRIIDKNEKSIKPLNEVTEQIKKELLNENKKIYALNLLNDENLEWDEIEKMLNPTSPKIENKPFKEDIEKIKDFQSNNNLEADGIWGPSSQSKYEEIENQKYNKSKIVSISESEESLINGSFKTMGRNYKLMGCLSAMKEGDITNPIDSNNKLFLVKLNSKTKLSDNEYDLKYTDTRDKIISNISDNIFYNWIQYMTENIEKIDVRHKSI
tara:strand:+ start:2527 stop:4260 length:1734 start_codon:yes stop_codon:yes gene_type:complete